MLITATTCDSWPRKLTGRYGITTVTGTAATPTPHELVPLTVTLVRRLPAEFDYGFVS